ncbi:MAG: hypothetical protein AB1689_09845 [Thermodesulfobacteriota bacterium]
MKPMAKLLALVCAAASVGLPLARGNDTASAAPAEDAALTERGRYIANDVAMCVQCHTPRDPNGDLDDTRLFQGAPMPVESPFGRQPWATYAPAIAGTGHLTDEDLRALLTTGRRTTGQAPLAPMPPFRMEEPDALAVIAYLRSLPAR